MGIGRGAAPGRRVGGTGPTWGADVFDDGTLHGDGEAEAAEAGGARAAVKRRRGGGVRAAAQWWRR